ncbi:MAG: hypothetical protein RL033_2228 [Pseudomonadota bacterium]
MSGRHFIRSLEASHLFAKGTGVLGLTALVALACNGRLAVLEPPVSNEPVGSAGTGGSSSTSDLVNHTAGAGSQDFTPDAGVALAEADAAPTPEPSPCSCGSSPGLMALGCGTGSVSGVPLVSDDGLTVTFDWCDEHSVCQPYRWTLAGGLKELPAPSTGATVSHLSPDGDVLVISPMETFGTEAIVYRASDGSSVGTGLRPYYASLALSADNSLVGLSVSGTGTTQLARWTRTGGREVLGDLPFLPDNVTLAGTPDAASIVGVNAGGAGELFRWTAEGGLEIEPQDLPAVARATPLSLSRNGSALGAYLQGEGSQVRIARWNSTGVAELATIPLSSVSRLGISTDGSVLAGSTFASELGLCELNPLNCSEYFSAFRWTEATGLVELTPGVASSGSVLSADGSLVVGVVHDGPGALFSWTAERGARNVRADLEAVGADLSDWELGEPLDMAANARVIVGQARCGSGTTIYRLVVPGELPLPN